MSEFDYSIVKDPRVFAINRVPAHSDHEFFGKVGYKYGDFSDLKHLLNGIWKFNYACNYNSAPVGFQNPNFDCSGWDQIRVPAHLQTEGYGNPQYVNTQYAWDGKEYVRPGQIPEHNNPIGCYVKDFEIPANMVSKKIYISFQGVESGFALWLNGAFVGYSEDSFTPSEFELTPYINNGINRLAVMVFKYTSGSWLEDQDFFNFSGIFRDVYLYATPKVHISNLRLTTDLDDTYTKAVLSIDMDSTESGIAEIEVVGENLDFKGAFNLTKGLNRLNISVDKPVLWSAEYPYLYDFNAKILDTSSNFNEFVCEKVGFRRFEIKNSIMLLNGKRIVFKGVNRHEFTSQSGRVMSDEVILKDIITMKRHNINAIRTSHYPNKTALYRLCDMFGMYVIDETNLETHGTWDIFWSGYESKEYAVPGNRPEYTDNVIDRAHSMFERDKNHPCILIWSLGNEAYGGNNLKKMHDAFHEWDRTRPVHYEGVQNDNRVSGISDIESTMYAKVADIKKYLSEHRERPYINCEYSHAMGNSCGAISWYTELAETEPLFQGGFIWDYIDQSLICFDRYGNEFQGYGGDFDDRPNDGSFSGNGIVYGKDRDPSPKLQEVKYCYQGIKIEINSAGNRAHIINKNLFTNTNAYDAFVCLEQMGVVCQKERINVNIPPLSSGDIDLPIRIPQDGSEYVVTVSFNLKEDTLWANTGHEVAYGQQAVGQFIAPKYSKQRLSVVEGYKNFGVYGEDFDCLFSKEGGLISYRYGGKEYIKNMPRPNFWRPMTENDNGNLLAFRAGQWKLASQYITMRDMNGSHNSKATMEVLPNKVVINYVYNLATKPLKQCNLKYEVMEDGFINVILHLDESSEIGELPEISVMMTLDSSLENLKWYGFGPMETYPDRDHAKLGMFKSKVADNMAKYLVPQECGLKMYVRHAVLTDYRGRGLEFVCNNNSLSVLPYSPSEIDNATHPTELPKPHFTYVRIGQQMGVGGDDSWGAYTHKEYMINNAAPIEISFSFRGI